MGLLLFALGSLRAQAPGDWPAYGRDAGGARFSPLVRIDTSNVSQLTVAWTFRTGELGLKVENSAAPSLEVTPILVAGTLYLSTPLGRVFALDPSTGTARWRFDPKVDPDAGYGDFTNRGVATWLDTTAAPNAACRRRILVATIDARLIALDAVSGDRCKGFGNDGTVDLRRRLRIPCSPPPFGSLVAVSLRTGAIVWDVPLGTLRRPDGTRGPAEWGSPNLGGPIATAGGLVFIGASTDRGLRAFESRTGRELWRADLPAGAKATPMTYEHHGRQYVVIAAGGGGLWGEGDSIIAFALPESRP